MFPFILMFSGILQHILYPLKTSENQRFDGVFRGYKMCCRIQENIEMETFVRNDLIQTGNRKILLSSMLVRYSLLTIYTLNRHHLLSLNPNSLISWTLYARMKVAAHQNANVMLHLHYAVENHTRCRARWDSCRFSLDNQNDGKPKSKTFI